MPYRVLILALRVAGTFGLSPRILQAILELAQRDNSFEEFSCTGSEHWGRHARQVRVFPTLCKLVLHLEQLQLLSCFFFLSQAAL